VNEQTIFTEALERTDPQQRNAFLDQACQGDPALRQRIDRLLAQHHHASSFLESPPAPVVQGNSPTLDQPPAERPGMQIGPYKLIEQIGEGGMGTVWMAQQTLPVKRQVAVKLIKAGMDSAQVIARFEAERQALALMDHVNIARVLDAGTTEAGRPYFVMDLVRGVPITRYCDEHHLTPKQRLELFIPVCQAIQHAHQKGIIHRDLKPSNVLVAHYDGKPVPKVIDFGVAKAAGQSLTDKTLVTGFGNVVGTLEYMSPEQAEINQLDIDTRSDIYSLGVLLYELLTGSPPFSRKELEQAGMLEMLRVIREQEPSKPSTKLSSSDALPTLSANRGTEPAKLTKLVRGELDWIVMKALEKDRSRRYETASGFAADVQRYLADEPVQACPPSAGYRLRKFVRRNKGRLLVAVVLGVALLFAVGTIGWAVRDRSAREAEIAHERANREAELKRERESRRAKVAGQVESILAEVDQFEKEQKWPAALAAARRAEGVVTSGEADAGTLERVRQRVKDLEFIDRLEHIRMQRATWVGGSFDYAGAERDYARAFRDYGVDVLELPVETSIDRLKARPPLAIPLAAALDDWVNSRRIAAGHDVTGWKQRVAVARGIDRDPLRDRLRSTWGRRITSAEQDDLRRLAESIDIRVHHPATLILLYRALRDWKLAESALRLLRDSQSANPGDFWLNFELAFALDEQIDHEGAIRFYTAAVAVRPNSYAALHNLGHALRAQGKLDEAIAAYRRAIEIRPQDAGAYLTLASALQRQQKLDEAVAAFRRAIDLDSKNAYPYAYGSLTNALRAQGKVDEAAAAYRQGIELATDQAAAYALGNAQFAEKNWDEAIAAYRKAIEFDAKSKLAAQAYFWIGKTPGKPEERLACIKKAAELDPTFIQAHNTLAWRMTNGGLKLRDPQGALEAARKAVELAPQDPFPWQMLGWAHYRAGDWKASIEALDKSCALQGSPKGGDAYQWFFLAMAHWQLGEKDKAREWYDKAVTWMETNAKDNSELIPFRKEAEELMKKE